MINKRTDRIDLRVYLEAKEALQAAATLRHKSVSEFIIVSALGVANEVLADCRPSLVEMRSNGRLFKSHLMHRCKHSHVLRN